MSKLEEILQSANQPIGVSELKAQLADLVLKNRKMEELINSLVVYADGLEKELKQYVDKGPGQDPDSPVEKADNFN